MRRIVSVWLIDWPVTVWTAGREPLPDGAPFALVERGTHGLTLRALNPAARRAGLWRGKSHADSRAVVPHLLSAPAEPDKEAAALASLAGWFERWSPSVASDPGEDGLEGLFVDMTGGTHLFGGEAALLTDMRTRLAKAGIRARLAIADTPGAAWGLARFSGKGESVVPPGASRETLANLPLEALRVGEDTLKLARRFGLRRVGDLYAMPRSGLARRFRDGDGLGLVKRLDQALGAEGEALAFQRPPPRYRACAVFAEPILDMAGIAARLDALGADLIAQLEADAMGARALTLAAFRTDGQVETLSVRLSLPSRNLAVWKRLLHEKGLDRIDPGFGIDALALAADVFEPVAERQPAIDGTEEDGGERLADLIDRLVARLGEDGVVKAQPFASWLPERAVRWVPAQSSDERCELASASPPRPILLLDRPEPIEVTAVVPEGAPAHFKWRRAARRVVRSEGPERLSPEWWRGRRPRRTRDYYRVEDDQGLRYWLFREGLYGWEDHARAPSWWVHGMFA